VLLSCSLVAVVVVRGVNPDQGQFDQNDYLDAQRYDPNNQQQMYYVTAAWDAVAIQRGEVPTVFAVGNNQMSTTAGGVTYTNGLLSSNTDYAVFVRYDIASDTGGVGSTLAAYSSTYFTRTGEH